MAVEDRPDLMQGVLTRRQIWKEPVGVVGAITPWNYPFEVSINKLGQALATGNTVILKPAPDTPWFATLIGRLVAEGTDSPAGVLNVVTSSDHPQVDLISFTGSTATGKRIAEKGAATMKRLFLELGGKSATIVDNSMTIAQEEIFGPVLVAIPYDDEDDAVRIANDSRYGLSGGVLSASLERSLAVARRVRTGVMSINGGNYYFADVPFGGYKESGVGRQNGTAGFDQYLETKSLAWPA